MAEQQGKYHAYMLRLWQVASGRTVVWRVSLEDPHTGERKGFANLDSLLAFLKEQTTPSARSSSPPGRERSDSG